MENKILKIEGISKTYKKGSTKALEDINLELTPGIYGLLGPNGAGKSTLINILTAGLYADTGEVQYNGENIQKMGEKYRALLGYMPQQQGLYDELTAIRFLKFFAALKGVKGKEVNQIIDNLLKRVGLEENGHQKIGTFSGGMKQRLLIAQALLAEPEILIMDEPTAGLDPNERIRLRNFISEIAGDKIVIYATHVVSDIESIAKEVILLNNGKIICKGSVEDLVQQMEGKVYELTVSEKDVEIYKQQYKISNMYRKQSEYILRIISDNKIEKDCQSVSGSLEDLYLYETK